jgi:hypothetical protein
MSRLWTRLAAPVLALLLVSGSQARAGNVNWHYNWTPSTLALFADADAGASGGFVTFTNEPVNAAINSSDIVATNLRTVSNASPNKPDTFTTKGTYSLTLQITDDASGKTGSLTFDGKLGGSLSTGNANVSNKFTGLITQQLVLGDTTYTVTIGPYTPPGPPSAANAGSISAHVDVSGIHVTANNPEPSTMVLSLFGLSAAGAGWWRRRRLAVA